MITGQICALRRILHIFYVIVNAAVAFFQLVLKEAHLSVYALVIQTVGLAVADKICLASRVPLEQTEACPGVAVSDRIEIRFRLDIGKQTAGGCCIQPHFSHKIIIYLNFIG